MDCVKQFGIELMSVGDLPIIVAWNADSYRKKTNKKLYISYSLTN